MYDIVSETCVEHEKGSKEFKKQNCIQLRPDIKDQTLSFVSKVVEDEVDKYTDNLNIELKINLLV